MKKEKPSETKILIIVMVSIVVLMLAGITMLWITTGNPIPFVPHESRPVPVNGTDDGEDVSSSESMNEDEEEETKEETAAELEISYDENEVKKLEDKINGFSCVSIEKQVYEVKQDTEFVNADGSVEMQMLSLDYYSLNISDGAIREMHYDAVSGAEYGMYHDATYSLKADTSQEDIVYKATDEPSAVSYDSYNSLMDFIYSLIDADYFKTAGSSFLAKDDEGGISFRYGRSSVMDTDFGSEGEISINMGFYGNELPTDCTITMTKTVGTQTVTRTICFRFYDYSNDALIIPPVTKS